MFDDARAFSDAHSAPTQDRAWRLRVCLVAAAAVTAASAPAALAGPGRPRPSAPSVAEHDLNDSDLGMVAARVQTPGDWLFRGNIVPPSPCVPTPYGVYRATSPEGLSFVEQLPVYGWTWTEGAVGQGAQKACLQFRQSLPAQQVLKVISATLNLQYLSDAPVPAAVNQAAQQALAAARAAYAAKFAASGLQQPRQTRELARAIVQFRNGSFLMKGRLSAVVDCAETHFAGLRSTLRGMADQPDWTLHNCTAQIRFAAAPVDKYEATLARLDRLDLNPKPSPAWVQAWVARNQQQTRQAIGGIIREGERRRADTTERYRQAMAISAANHQQFLATLQRGTDLSMQRAADVANSNHRMAMDVVDYALDRQTVRDPNTGQLSKISSAYAYTWVDETGRTAFQTSDVNANPNDYVHGTWTRQTVTHGDGSP